jgi:hypothetical protein
MFKVPVQLKRCNQFHPATIRFGSDADIGRIRHWPDFIAEDATGTAIEAAGYAFDSLERFEKHRGLNRVANSPQDFDSLIQSKPKDDFVMLLVLEAQWWQPEDLLGFAYLRRTWAGNLYMEFLAKHPLATYSEPPDLKVSGVIEAVLVGLAHLLDEVGENERPEWLWWESTEGSAKVYERFFAPTIPNDLVIVSAKELAGCRCQILHQFWQAKS